MLLVLKDKKPFSWKEAQEYYMYPLLLACYTRQGAAAEAALQGLSQCLDAGVFDDAVALSGACRLEVAVDAVASICHQGVKSRFALALPFFRKVTSFVLLDYSKIAESDNRVCLCDLSDNSKVWQRVQPSSFACHSEIRHLHW